MAETRSTCCSNNPEEEVSIRNRPSNIPSWGFLLLLTLIISVSIVLLIIWVYIFPKPFDMKVKDATASDYYFTDSHLDATFHVTLRFRNPNRMLTIHYLWLNVTIERDNQPLAFQEYMDPIVQAPGNSTFLNGTMKSSDVNVKSKDDETQEDLKPTSSRDYIIVDIRVRMKILLCTRYWRSKFHTIETFCSNVKFHQIPRRPLLGKIPRRKKNHKDDIDVSIPKPKFKQCHVYL